MENTARNIDLGSVITITQSEKPSKKRRDRFNTDIVSEEDFTQDTHHADCLENKEDINNMILALNKCDVTSMVLFIIGINVGYRPVDLLAWRWNQITNSNGNFLTTFAMFEHKTSKTAIVNLNPVVIKILSWFREYKKEHEENFSDENFVFSSMENRGNKSFVYLDKDANTMWHSDKNHKKKGLMFSYDNGKKVTCNEDTILNDDSGRFLKLRTPVDTDTLSKKFIKCAKIAGIEGHYSSYVVRHTFCFHFVGVAMDDSKFNEISRRERATMLLSKYLNHSSTKITIDYYMRFENKAISGIVFELNLGKEAVDMIVDKYNKGKKDCGEQMCLL